MYFGLSLGVTFPLNIIVGIPHGICGGCHMKMPTYVSVATKGELEIVQCINCQRILYFTRDMEE